MILLNNKRIDGVSLDTVPVGTISPFIGLVAPQGYLLCQGQKVSKNRYKQLYNICKSLFGPETETEFYLPDLRGRVIAGLNENDTTMDTIGKILGTYEHNHSTGNHTLTIDEIPSHRHTNTIEIYYGVGDYGHTQHTQIRDNLNLEKKATQYSDYTGGGGAHNHGDTGLASNYQPTTVMNYIVKAEMVIPNQSTVYDGLDSDSEVDSLSARQGKILNTKIDSLVIPTVNNTLTSTSTTEALSAAQGKNLNDTLNIFNSNKIDTIGYQKLPSGLIIQWGREYFAGITTQQYTKNLKFPLEFPHTCFHVIATLSDVAWAAETVTTGLGVRDFTTTGFNANIKATNTTSKNVYVWWMAIGY